MNNESVMKHQESSNTFQEKLEQEYQEAISEGFKGTKEEYLQLRDYT